MLHECPSSGDALLEFVFGLASRVASDLGCHQKIYRVPVGRFIAGRGPAWLHVREGERKLGAASCSPAVCWPDDSSRVLANYRPSPPEVLIGERKREWCWKKKP